MALTKKQIENFREQLLELHQRLRGQLEEAQAGVKAPEEGKGYSQHQADEGTDDFDRTISIELTTQETDILRKVERALEKVDENTYGVCDITGDPIALKRLEAIPYANTTRDAQEAMEEGKLP